MERQQEEGEREDKAEGEDVEAEGEDVEAEEEVEHTETQPEQEEEEEQPMLVPPVAPLTIPDRVSSFPRTICNAAAGPSTLLLLFRCCFFILSETDHVLPSLSSDP